jgi:hypothetical protein
MESAQKPSTEKKKQRRSRHGRQLGWRIALALGFILSTAHGEQDVTVAWDPSTTPDVAGYILYFGTNSGAYSDLVVGGPTTVAIAPGLLEGVTYYFAATAYTTNGVESDQSDELSYTIPIGTPGPNSPTLSPLVNLTLNEDAGQQTVALQGISSGLGGIITALLGVTVSSSNPALIPTPTVTYSIPNTTGTLRFTPVANAFGIATITVTVNNFQLLNNLFSRTFSVIVNPVNDPPTLNDLSDLSLAADAGTQTVSLSGISSGAPNEDQTLVVSATSSNPGLVPNPTVNYLGGNAEGTLSFTAVPGASGTATISVTVFDGQTQNSSISRTFTVTVEADTTAEVPGRALYLEAESGSLSSPMAIAVDPMASNGRFIYSSRSEQGTVTLQFDVAEPDAYVVWCRVLSVDTSTDSFYVSVDGAPEEVFRTAPNAWSSQWQWSRIDDGTTSAPRFFPLDTGTHTLTFRSREASTLLDAVYVTNDPDFVPLRLALAPVTSPVRGMQISFQSSPGYRYQLQATEDFRAWSTIWSTPLASSSSLFSFVDPISPASRGRFYRVRINSSNDVDALPLALPLDLTVSPSATPVRGMNISFQATAGFQYQIQATEDFRTWVPIWDSPVSIANELLSVVDTASTMQRARFYRIQINPPNLFASASAPTQLFITAEGGLGRGIRVSFQAAGGRQHQLQVTEDFRSWTPIWNSPVTTANQLVSFVDTITTATGARFYRVQRN